MGEAHARACRVQSVMAPKILKHRALGPSLPLTGPTAAPPGLLKCVLDYG